MREHCVEVEGGRLVVDRGSQLLRADLDEGAGPGEHPPPGAVGWDTLSSGVRVYSEAASWTAPIISTVAAARVGPDFTPAMTLECKARAYDARLGAALVRLIHDGAGRVTGRRRLVQQLVEATDELTIVDEGGGSDRAMARVEGVRGLLEAALHVAGEPLPEDGTRKGFARKWLGRFLRDPLHARPFGSYAATEHLRQIWQFDRLLQVELRQREQQTLRMVVESSPELSQAYAWHLALGRRLSGPGLGRGVTEPARGGEGVAVFPPFDLPGATMGERMTARVAAGGAAELGAPLISRLRAGSFDTRLQPNDGWPVHGLHVRAVQLSPDTDGLTVGSTYREDLEGRFAAATGGERRPHIKRPVPHRRPVGAVVLAPTVTVEPLPELYRRAAEAYAALRQVLADALGDGLLSSGGDHDHPLSLYDELCELELLFRGAWVVSREELGRPVELDRSARDAARLVFRSWQLRCSDDPDLAVDLRQAIPLTYDSSRRTFQAILWLGLETRRLRVEFARPPRVRFHGSGRGAALAPEPLFTAAEVMVLSPITTTCVLNKLPDPEELRRLGDQLADPDSVRAALA